MPWNGESQDKRTVGASNEISRPGTSSISFHNASGGKFISPADVRPIFHLTAKCSAPIDEAKQSTASRTKLLTDSPYRKQLRECQEKKSLSLSKKPAIKWLLGTKSKRSSKKRRVDIQESPTESDMEIEFESDDSCDDISDGDAKRAYTAQGFSEMTSMAKNGFSVRCYRWAHEDCGVRKTTLCAEKV